MNTAQQTTQQLPTIEQATSEFQAGVTAAMRSWSAFRTAVQNEWGGIQSREKAEFLRNYIFESLDYSLPKPKLDIDDLEDHLDDYMDQEFSIELDDGSAKEVAELIWQLYQSCGKGDFSLSRDIVTKSATISTSNEKVKVQCNEDDDSDDEMGGTANIVLRADSYLFGVPQSEIERNAPVKPKQPKPEPIVDDDGFTMVAKK
jgi:pre-rRNA-processing protein TSR2